MFVAIDHVSKNSISHLVKNRNIYNTYSNIYICVCVCLRGQKITGLEVIKIPTMTRSEAGQPKYLSMSSAVPAGFFTSTSIRNSFKNSFSTLT